MAEQSPPPLSRSGAVVEVLAEPIPSPPGAVLTFGVGHPHEEVEHDCRSLLHSENIRRETPVLAE